MMYLLSNQRFVQLQLNGEFDKLMEEETSISHSKTETP